MNTVGSPTQELVKLAAMRLEIMDDTVVGLSYKSSPKANQIKQQVVLLVFSTV